MWDDLFPTFPLPLRTWHGENYGRMNTKRIAVVGGGISGLAAAWELRKRAGPSLEVHLFESSPRLGGVIETDRRSGLVIEGGPDSFVTRKPEAIGLARELGLGDALIGTQRRVSYIYLKGRFHPVPPISPLGIPASLGSMVRTGLFTPAGKVRALADLFLRRSKVSLEGPDVSVGSFLRRRLGNELVDRMIAPLAGGVHLTDVDELSLQAVYPSLLHLAVEHRSLILATVGRARKVGNPREESPFMTLRTGLSTLVEAMQRNLAPVGVHLREPVTGLTHANGEYGLESPGGGKQRFDGIILAAPTYASSSLLREMDRSLSVLVGQLTHSPIVVVGLVYPTAAFPPALEGNGFMVPRAEGLEIAGVTWLNRKWAYTEKETGVSMRVFLTRGLEHGTSSLTPEQAVEVATRGLATTMGVTEKPNYVVVFQHERAMPQYRVGHLGWMRQVEEGRRKWPDLAFAGAAFGGVGMPDCIRSGQLAATTLLQSLR